MNCEKCGITDVQLRIKCTDSFIHSEFRPIYCIKCIKSHYKIKVVGDSIKCGKYTWFYPVNTQGYLCSTEEIIEWRKDKKLLQHNEKCKKLGLTTVDKLPDQKECDDINERYITSRYVPGGDMFEQAQEEIENLLSM